MKAKRYVELSGADWKLAGCAGGFALVTRWVTEESQWLDLRAWPAVAIGPRVAGWARSVAVARDGTIAALVGWDAQRVATWDATLDDRRDLVLPRTHGYRSVGFVGDAQLVLVPGALAYDNLACPLAYAPVPVWHDGHALVEMDGAGGGAWEASGVVPLVDGDDWIVWTGRVYSWQARGRLFDFDLSAAQSLVGWDDGFFAIVDGRAARIRASTGYAPIGGARKATAIARYDKRLVITSGRRTWLHEVATGKELELDTRPLGDDHEPVFAAPCGLVALAHGGAAIASLRA